MWLFGRINSLFFLIISHIFKLDMNLLGDFYSSSDCLLLMCIHVRRWNIIVGKKTCSQRGDLVVVVDWFFVVLFYGTMTFL